MLWIDFKNAVNGTGDNFTCILFRLMMKSDSTNLKKLSSIYPDEAAMVEIYRSSRCPYKEEARINPDFELIEVMAKNSLTIN
jgi:hypothetical protein